MSNDVKNFFLAIGISVLIFLGFNYFYPQEEPSPKVVQPQTSQAAPSAQVAVPPSLSPVILDRKDALQLVDRAFFETAVTIGSINLRTGAIDDLHLKNYRQTPKKDSEFVALLNPEDTLNTNMMSIDVLNVENANSVDDTVWTTVNTQDRRTVVLTKTLSYMTIKRTFKFGDDYTISIQDEILNTANTPLKLRMIQKLHTTESHLIDSFSLITDGRLKEYTPGNISKKDMISHQGLTGFIGGGTKYWFMSFMQPQSMQTEFLLSRINRGHEIRLSYPTVVVAAQGKIDQNYLAFCGPKSLDVLESVRDQYNVQKFDLAVDFGWFYFLTKPLLKGINIVHKYVSNFGWAIIILTTLMKLALWPLAVKSHKSMLAMKKLQPKMDKLKQKWSSDKIRLNQEIMMLYKKENIKPMGGCLPILMQVPIFFCLYKVLSINIEMRHAPFILWIKDLAEPDPTSFANLFGLLPYDVPNVLMIGLLPILMGLTMFIQQKLTPSASTDPSQERIMALMPLFLTYVFASFPSGLVLYWLWSNVLSILQQLWMNKRYQ